MPRGLTVDQKAQLAARIRRPAYFVRLDLASGTVRAWSGRGDVATLGGTWKGVGEFGIIDGLEHDRGLKAQSIRIGLVGVPAQVFAGGLLDEARAERYQWRPLSIYLGFLDINTEALLSDPTAIWSGYADAMAFRIGNTVSITLPGEHLSSVLRLPNGLRMTTEAHNARLGNPTPRDMFFEPQDRLMGRPRATPGT